MKPQYKALIFSIIAIFFVLILSLPKSTASALNGLDGAKKKLLEEAKEVMKESIERFANQSFINSDTGFEIQVLEESLEHLVYGRVWTKKYEDENRTFLRLFSSFDEVIEKMRYVGKRLDYKRNNGKYVHYFEYEIQELPILITVKEFRKKMLYDAIWVQK
jgi:hypothetical protein